MKKRRIIAIIILSIVVISGLSYYFLTKNIIETKTEEGGVIKDKDSNISLNIYLDYEVKKTNLIINNLKYSLTYKSVPMKVYQIYGFSFNRENLDDGKVSTWYSETIDSINFSHFPSNSPPMALATPGSYIFFYYVYDCRRVEQLTGKTCSDADKKEVVEKVESLNNIKKVVEFNPISG